MPKRGKFPEEGQDHLFALFAQIGPLQEMRPLHFWEKRLTFLALSTVASTSNSRPETILAA
jgi:hypothetical protein